MKKTLLTIFCSAVLLSSGCVALQQDMESMEQRLSALEYRNQELQKQVNSEISAVGERENSEKSLRGQYASMNATVEAMQQDLRLINGRVEEVEYLAKRKVADLDTDSQKRQDRLDELSLSVAKMEQRLAVVEQYLNLEGKSASPPSTSPVAGTAPQATASDKQLYDEAYKALGKGEMDKARQLYQKIIQDYPKSDLADNAQFNIGESYYKEKWYEKAILEYQTVIEKYPKGNKVPAAMLKQGLSLKQIGEKASARLILQELVKKYPKSSEAGIASQKLKEF